jgi:hypothetical protein
MRALGRKTVEFRLCRLRLKAALCNFRAGILPAVKAVIITSLLGSQAKVKPGALMPTCI